MSGYKSIDRIRTVTAGTFDRLVLKGEGPIVALDRELADAYEVQGTPTLVMFLNGAVVGREEGPSPDVSNLLAVVSQPYAS